MTLEEYALGHEHAEDSFCRWMEFKSQALGSIRGGSAYKLIIYKRKDAPGWFYPKDLPNERTAWERLRADFVRALELAKGGEWDEIDELGTLSRGPALKLKTLHLYFPNEILPVYSTDHLRHYLRLLERPDDARSSSVVQLNRHLLSALRERDELANWTTKEMERLLYWWADPRDARRVYKIAPGEGAQFWEECRAGGYICVGWDEMGDLRGFEAKEDFKERFAEVFGATYKHRQNKISEKANELWTLMELEPGDLVVANHGLSRILAVGEVVEPGYTFDDTRPEFKHTVAVAWDTAYEKTISAQKRWQFVTVAKIPDALLETILRRGKGPTALIRPAPVPVDPLYRRIADALERKGQLILYGPPGTGKTYTARRFAVWWLLRRRGDAEADAVLAESDRMDAGERRLSTAQVTQRIWWVVANPKEWTWDRLFRDGQVEYRHGRLQRNYPLVQRGDTVVGYQSTPDKKIVALAKVAREFQSTDGRPPTILLEPLARVANGPTYEELLADAVLVRSEPMRFRNQGTLFALTGEESDHLLAGLVERNPELAGALGGDAAAGETTVGPLTRVTFHPSYTYEDFIEGFRPTETGQEGLSLRLEDGIFKRVCRTAQAHPDETFLLLVDEINRGNVAKILGELLTLLERDKRRLTVTLPQSKESFAVPPNVYLLGTMNTADRSIKLLDAALRRRFAFVELMPDVELLRGASIGELALDEFLEELNRRIAAEEGREKQIGHSYLLDEGQPISDAGEFAARFREEILPLLQEYCYDDYPTLAKYLGTVLVDAEAQQLDEECLADPERLIATLAAGLNVGEGIDE
jgi:5-methylcytosine-specific restriction protein B